MQCKDPEKEEKRRLKISKAMKGNTNWMFNKRKGNGKKGWYDGEFFDSAWELAFYVYYKEHNLNIKRYGYTADPLKYVFEGSIHRYFPDFITDEGIVEIKGRMNEKAKAKAIQFPDIIIIDKDKMKPILDYIISKYGDNYWEVLYLNRPKKEKGKYFEDLKNRRKFIFENIKNKYINLVDLNEDSKVLQLHNFFKEDGFDISSKLIIKSIKEFGDDEFKNSFFGSSKRTGSKGQIWITNPVTNERKRIKINELDNYIEWNYKKTV